jgi:hypothetical protein
MNTVICNLLKLNANAGLGWRLCQARIKVGDVRANCYYLVTDDALEAADLANALNAAAGAGSTRFAPYKVIDTSTFCNA